MAPSLPAILHARQKEDTLFAWPEKVFATPRADTTLFSVLDSPMGELLALSDGASLTGLYMGSERRPHSITAGWKRDPGWFRQVATQLAAYFAGELRRFELSLAPRGTPFQLSVWRQLVDIPYGRTTSYGDIARRVGRPGAARAVGVANGSNPIPIIVPCHRVIGSDGSLTGYGGGIDRKARLLRLEAGVLTCLE
jgi:methylated-DNA-[protein]-cysteine S-methyltransferase